MSISPHGYEHDSIFVENPENQINFPTCRCKMSGKATRDLTMMHCAWLSNNCTGLVVFTKEVEYHQKMVLFMLKHGFFTVAKASSCGMNQVEYHKKVMVFMVDNQPRIIHGWWDDKEFVSRYYSNILHYPNSTTISFERIFLSIPLPPPNPFSLAIHVPKEKSKEMALESIPSASWGFADSPYDVAISRQSPPLCICPVVPARLSLCTSNSFSHPLTSPQYLYFPKLHCPRSYLQCKFEVAPFVLFSFFLVDRREEIVT